MKRESKKKRNCSSSTCNCLQITDLHCWNGTTRDKRQAVIQWPLYGEYNHNRKNVSLPLFHRRAAHITLSSPSLFIWTGDYHKLAICIISTCSGDSTLTHTFVNAKEPWVMLTSEEVLKSPWSQNWKILLVYGILQWLEMIYPHN